jgi:hypothetical protein
MTVARTGEIAFVLFLTAALDHPFRGVAAVGPEAFLEIVARIQKLSTE